MRINLKTKDWGLKHKIILNVLVISAMATLLWTFLFISAQNSLIRMFNQEQLELVGSLIRCNLTYLMSQDGQVDIALILKRMEGLDNIQKVRILDENGEIQHSSNENEKGKMLPEKEMETFQSLYKGKDTKRISSFNESGVSIGLFPVQNEASCYSCHDPSQKVNGILEMKLVGTKVNRLLQRKRIQSAVVALGALVVFIFIIFWLFKTIINKPLSILKEEMEKVRAGDLKVRVEPRKNDEIGELSRCFNLMVENLNKAQMKIKELHRYQMEKASHLASLGELAAGLAHEIKNPIAGIKSSVEIIYQKTPSENPEKMIFLEILKQTDLIYMIIQDLLNYAKPKPLSCGPVDINHIVSHAIKLAEPHIKNKKIDIDFKPLSGDTVFLLDENKIQEVLLNLILNSIKAIEQKGQITLTVAEQKDELTISIADTGRGIQPEHLKKVFSPFFTTSRGGTGLGLSICLRIIEEHRGSIKVYSQLGEGTEFIIKIPVRKKKTD
jgi:signal transduction histidine kinase